MTLRDDLNIFTNLFADIAPHAVLDADELASRVWEAVLDNAHGEWDGIITLVAPALGETGLSALDALIQEYGDASLTDGSTDHKAIQFLRQLRGGTNYAAERKAKFVKACLQEIAAVLGDTSAYIAQYSDDDLARKDVAAEVAVLLLAEDQAAQALEILRDVDPSLNASGQDAWDSAYVGCLLALGQVADAQDHRWACFLETLSVEHLRAYLKLLPDLMTSRLKNAQRRM